MRRLLLLLCLLPALAWTDEIELIPLHNRPAEDLIPLIQPMLGPGEAISGEGSLIILRASPATLAEIRQLLDEMDRAPRNLIISVSSSSQDLREGRSAGGRIDIGPDGTHVQGMIGSRERAGERGAIQQIRVLEGMPAMLHVGEETHRIEPMLVPYPGGYAVVPSTTTRSTGRWLRVVPRLQGQQVLLDIQPEEAFPDPRHPRTLEIQRISTQIVVPLGQWVPLGGLDSQEQHSSGLSGGSRSQTSEVWVRVELAGEPR